MSADRQQSGGGGLSVQTLAVASLASMTAAVVIHEFWTYGAILGAAITPVIVGVTSEVLKRPINRASRLADERRERSTATQGHATVPTGPPAPDPDRGEDPFGIWQDEQRDPWYRRFNRRHLRLGLITGVVAFAIGAVALTATELVFGGSIGSGGKRTTLVPGGDRDREQRDEEPRPGATQPEQDEQESPDESPTPTQPAPGETEPEPTPTEPAPAPEPSEPAPAPGGTPAPDDTAPSG